MLFRKFLPLLPKINFWWEDLSISLCLHPILRFSFHFLMYWDPVLNRSATRDSEFTVLEIKIVLLVANQTSERH